MVIEDGWSHQHNLCACGVAMLYHSRDAIPEGLHPILTVGQIDAVVHAVAGHDECRFHRLQCTAESFVDAGPWELSAGVSFFGQPRGGFAAQADADDVAG